MSQESLKSIGRYKIEKKIGQGATGSVYLGWDSFIRRRVAIKSLRMERLKTEEDRKHTRNLFFQEARIIGNLNHSHITAVYDMGVEENGAPYIVMEYIDGLNIRSILDKEKIYSLKEKVNILSMVARALHYAHQRGVLHRDIKPANIMIQKNRAPKITDFGIARIMNLGPSGQPGNSGEEGVLGTPQYMSPEQILGEEMDHRSDIFSLGILAYEWVSGQKTFRGKDTESLLSAILEASPKPLSQISDADEALESIISRALAKDVKDRFQSADELSDALEMYIHKMEMEGTHIESQDYSFDKIRVVERLKKDYLFFSDFSNRELFSLFKLSHKEKFRKGEYLIRQGTSGTKMYIIIKGSVAIVNELEGRKMELEKLEEGSCVGEMSIIDRMPRSASVIARKSTVAIAINETVLRLSNPKLCLKLYRNLAAMISERLRNNTSKYLELLATVQKGEVPVSAPTTNV